MKGMVHHPKVQRRRSVQVVIDQRDQGEHCAEDRHANPEGHWNGTDFLEASVDHEC